MLKRALGLVALYFLASCVSGFLDDEPSPRAQPQTAGEIAFTKVFLNSIQAQSFADNREYCGYIGINPDGTFGATEARRGKMNNCVPRYAARDFKALASYHTHGAASEQVETEYPSYEDLRADIYEGVDGYIATPGGRLWYNNAATHRSELLCGAYCLTSDPRHQETSSLPAGTSFSLDELN